MKQYIDFVFMYYYALNHVIYRSDATWTCNMLQCSYVWL